MSQEASNPESYPAEDAFSLTRFLRARKWDFFSADGRPIAAGLRLMPGGRILGYSHPNESGWRIHRGKLEFVDAAGRPTTRFETRANLSDGRIRWIGAFSGEPAGTVHVLQESLGPLEAATPGQRLAMIVPIHAPYFIYGINLLFQSFGADYDLVFVFSTHGDRMAFARMHPSTDAMRYYDVVFDEHLDAEAIAQVAERNTWPSLKKLAALAFVYPHYDYALCVDAETFVLKVSGWTEAVREALDANVWHGGRLTDRMEAERRILIASAAEAPGRRDFDSIQSATQDFSVYSWWWDLPAYDCRHIPGFLAWIDWRGDAGFASRITWNTFEHLTYQYYTLVHEGFSLRKVDSVVHSLEFSRAAVVKHVHAEVAPVRWTNALAYAEDPGFFQSNGYLAFFHIDRKSFPQFA